MTQEVTNRMVEYGGKRHTYMLKLNAEEYIDSTRQVLHSTPRTWHI